MYKGSHSVAGISTCEVGTLKSTCNNTFWWERSVCRYRDLERSNLTIRVSKFLINGEALHENYIEGKGNTSNCFERKTRINDGAYSQPHREVEERDGLSTDTNGVHRHRLFTVTIVSWDVARFPNQQPVNVDMKVLLIPHSIEWGRRGCLRHKAHRKLRFEWWSLLMTQKDEHKSRWEPGEFNFDSSFWVIWKSGDDGMPLDFRGIHT